jgi:hypothetical protein
MPPISHASHPELLDPLWLSVIRMGLDANSKRDMIPLLYADAKSTKAGEKVIGISDLEPTPKFTGAISIAEPVMLHQKSVDFPEYAQGVSVTRKMLEDMQHDQIKKELWGLTDAYFDRKQIDGIDNMFEFAFSGPPTDMPQYLAPDGLSLINTNHTWHAGGGVISNRVIGTFSKPTLQAAFRLARKLTRPRGRPWRVRFDLLVVPTDLVETAQEIIASKQGPYTANLGENILGGDVNRLLIFENPLNIKILEVPALADQTAAFLVSTQRCKQSDALRWFQRIAPETEVVQLPNTFTRTYTLRARHGLLMQDPFWVVGMKP